MARLRKLLLGILERGDRAAIDAEDHVVGERLIHARGAGQVRRLGRGRHPLPVLVQEEVFRNLSCRLFVGLSRLLMRLAEG